MLLLHGLAGGWDELIIAVVAIGVLWFAVKLAGRKAVDEETEDEGTVTEDADQQPSEAARPPATPLGQ